MTLEVLWNHIFWHRDSKILPCYIHHTVMVIIHEFTKYVMKCYAMKQHSDMTVLYRGQKYFNIALVPQDE